MPTLSHPLGSPIFSTMENEMVILTAILIGVATGLTYALCTGRKAMARMCNRCDECGEPACIDLDTGDCFCVDCYKSYVAVSEEADKGEDK